jgi:hypothetical protein
MIRPPAHQIRQGTDWPAEITSSRSCGWIGFVGLGSCGGSFGFGRRWLLPDRSEIHVSVESADGQPVEQSMKRSILVKASFADFQPDEMSSAQTPSGECAVSGCLGFSHVNALAGSQMRVKMVVSGLLEIIVAVINECRVVVP